MFSFLFFPKKQSDFHQSDCVLPIFEVQIQEKNRSQTKNKIQTYYSVQMLQLLRALVCAYRVAARHDPFCDN